MAADLRHLQSRFQRAAAAAGARGSSEGLFAELVSRYAEPHRHYHTLTHIAACLGWLHRFEANADHSEEVELALWFHDVIYTPGAGDNEQRSAQLARDRLAALGVADDPIGRVARHIQATEHHPAGTGDTALVIDLDLTILGSPPQAFDRFEEQIRREYGQVPEAMYRAGRCHVLESFLSRPVIYSVPPIRERLEAAARTNLARRVGELTRRP